jgi:hypothetical protein
MENGMIVANRALVNVGDAFTRNGDTQSRFTVNRIEKTTIESGVEKINAVRLRQIAPIVLETDEQRQANRYKNPSGIKTVFVDVTVEELFAQYSLVRRREAGDKSLIQDLINAKDENHKMLHRIDDAVRILRIAERHDDWNNRRVGKDSLHLDADYLSEALGDVVVFKSHRWLASLIYFIDKLGKNFNASISSKMFEIEEGYGFVTISSTRWFKRVPLRVLSYLLEKLNSKHQFTRSEFVNYPDAAWEEEDSYSMQDLIENKHRDNKWSIDRGAGIEATAGSPYARNAQELVNVQVDVDKLPSKEEILEQTRLMKQYEDDVVRKAAAEKYGKQTVPTVAHVITPQGE